MYKDPCEDWLDLINKKLTSPNYPKPYNPLTDCKWNLKTDPGKYITLDFERIDVSISNKFQNISLISAVMFEG